MMVVNKPIFSYSNEWLNTERPCLYVCVNFSRKFCANAVALYDQVLL